MAGAELLHPLAAFSARRHRRRRSPIQTFHYAVTLRPLNASDVSGSARLDLTGNVLVVTIHANGLQPNREHYQHIHGNLGGVVACPTPADADASGMLTVARGLAVVGPIVLDLQPYPSVTGPGAVDWAQSYTLTPDEQSSLVPLTDHVVVLHGMTSHGVYDRALFVACGAIRAA
ncbi:MAG TPA: hypothetical protein VE258_18895 [Ktedonobacterales bacterium]|nr:hypothetical protein [Ktedonobacterales bacterium]